MYLSEIEVSCILLSDDTTVEKSVHGDGDELGKVVSLVKRGYWVTARDWDMKFIDLETEEEYISQKSMRFHTQEDLSNENEFDEMVAENNKLSSRVSELEEEVPSLLLHHAKLNQYSCSPIIQKSQSQLGKRFELQAQLNQTHEDLRKANEQIAVLEKDKVKSLDDLKGFEKLNKEANEKLKEALAGIEAVHK